MPTGLTVCVRARPVKPNMFHQGVSVAEIQKKVGFQARTRSSEGAENCDTA